jgi:hypothetical protein
MMVFGFGAGPEYRMYTDSTAGLNMGPVQHREYTDVDINSVLNTDWYLIAAGTAGAAAVAGVALAHMVHAIA